MYGTSTAARPTSAIAISCTRVAYTSTWKKLDPVTAHHSVRNDATSVMSTATYGEPLPESRVTNFGRMPSNAYANSMRVGWMNEM